MLDKYVKLLTGDSFELGIIALREAKLSELDLYKIVLRSCTLKYDSDKNDNLWIVLFGNISLRKDVEYEPRQTSNYSYTGCWIIQRDVKGTQRYIQNRRNSMVPLLDYIIEQYELR